MLTLVDPTDASSLELLRVVLREAERADGTSAFSDQAVLSAKQGTRSLYAVQGGADQPVGGFGLLGSGELDLVIRPEARGIGLGTAALNELLARATASGSTPKIRSWTHGTNEAPRALLRGADFAGIRTLYKMELDTVLLPQAVAGARPLPQGALREAFDASRPEHIDAWLHINSSAFADHPEQGSMTREDFTALTHEPWFRADDLNFVRVTDLEQRLLGFSWVKTTPEVQGTGVETELYVLGVHPDAAGQGLGAALFGVALERMLASGPTTVSLYVDAHNTAAVALYERAGFTVAAQSTQWERSLTVS